MKIKFKTQLIPILIVIAIFLFLFVLKYWQMFTASNWGKYYFQKMTWEKIISDPASHKEPLIASFVILVFAILYVTIRDRKKGK
jgi:hypothetical protein